MYMIMQHTKSLQNPFTFFSFILIQQSFSKIKVLLLYTFMYRKMTVQRIAILLYVLKLTTMEYHQTFAMIVKSFSFCSITMNVSERVIYFINGFSNFVRISCLCNEGLSSIHLLSENDFIPQAHTNTTTTSTECC